MCFDIIAIYFFLTRVFTKLIPHFPDSIGDMEVRKLMSCIGLNKFAGVIFGITQKPLCITPSNLVT